MSFVAMAAAGATVLGTVGITGAVGTIGGAALAGGALGATTGAIGSAITGGDIGEGALMGAGTGAITAGVGSAVATPAATAATAGIQEGIKTGAQSALLNPIVNASGQVINQGTSLAAGQTAGQLAQQGAQQGIKTGAQSALLNPVTNAAGQVINPATSLATGTAAAAPTAAAPAGSEVAKQAAQQGIKQGATNMFGDVAAPLSTSARAGVAGLSRTGIGLASGEDIEQAGIAGLTSGAATGLLGGLGELSSDPAVGELSASEVLAKDIGALPSADTQLIPPSDLSSQFDSWLQAKYAPDIDGTAFGNPMDMPEFQLPSAAPSDISPDWTPASDSWTTAAGETTGDYLSPPAFEPMSNYQPVEGSLGPAPAPEPAWYQTEAAADTNLTDRPGNLYDSFNTYDKFSANAPGILAPGAVTAAGLGSMADANYYKDNLSGYEKMMAERRKGYGDTVQSIQDSYARAGRDAPTGLYGTDWTVPSYAGGGIAGLTRGAGDGTSDSIPAIIDGGTNGQQRARLSTDEFVVPADVVSHLGNGSTKAGAETLYAMMNRIRDDRTASKSQPEDINPKNYVPA